MTNSPLKYSVFFLICICTVVPGGLCQFYEQFNKVRPNTTPQIQENAALEVIKRSVKTQASLFEVHVDLSLNENTFKILNNRETNGTVKISGSSGTAVTRGFYYYLRYYLDGQISWDGDNLDQLKTPFPFINYTSSSPNRFIYYQNVCTYSYSFVWWSWDEWRRHLDWMALQGINLFIAPVQEEIWSRIYRELNMTEEEINEHFSGPAFLAWQRMGNIRGWGGPLTSNFKKWSMNLQKRIINAARDLGMTVALPGFAGHVPRAFLRIFPNVTYEPVTKWNRFEDAYCCPLFLDPTDTLFQYIGEWLLREITLEYGSDHIYFSDPYNELIPVQADANYIRNVSKSIYSVMKTFDPDAIWLLQGWMFHSDAAFWTEDLIRSFVTANDLGSMLILDLQSEQNPQYMRTNSYYGQPFIWCMLHNFGGTLGMFGSFDIINKNPIEAKLMPGSTMVGFGITPEGINQNYVIYEFALEMGWTMKSQNLTIWLQHYIKSRYGHYNEKIGRAWDILANSVYSYHSLEQMRGKYVYNRRPSMRLLPWTWYNATEVKVAWDLFLQSTNNFESNSLFRHDLIDITRQYLQTLTDRYYQKIRKHFYRHELTELCQLSHEFIHILTDIDRILATDCSLMLGTWLESANRLAYEVGDGNIKDVYESNARYQITLWGPKGEIVDYANKQWSGVVMNFFIPRWKVFFRILKKSIRKNKKINNNTLKLKIMKDAEYPFVNSRNYTTICKGDPIKISLELYERWSSKDEDLQLPILPDEISI